MVGIVTRRYGLGGIGSIAPPSAAGQQKRRIGAPAVATIRAPLAVSSAEPPPIATTTSQPDARSASPHASTLSVVGSWRAISYTSAPAGTGGVGHVRVEHDERARQPGLGQDLRQLPRDPVTEPDPHGQEVRERPLRRHGHATGWPSAA